MIIFRKVPLWSFHPCFCEIAKAFNDGMISSARQGIIYAKRSNAFSCAGLQMAVKLFLFTVVVYKEHQEIFVLG